MGSAILRQDEVATVLVVVLNSRPMVAPSSNSNGGEVLTPGHFLIGATLVPLPTVSSEPVDDVKPTHLKRWQLISNIKRRFYSDWSRDQPPAEVEVDEGEAERRGRRSRARGRGQRSSTTVDDRSYSRRIW
ncbi:hypothetical protein AWZ03_015396 [Drosophila navojoa]|uniref:Uncharacterized protein n=1 Tax=Drosophila navojoa TaxID=7232 RepID=A0A484APL5_DRONA|nr:hypothetical protein AWZ03_015396 [Drosophila navojoa]